MLRVESVAEKTDQHCELSSGDNKEQFDMLKENGSPQAAATTMVSLPYASSSTCGVRLEGAQPIMIVSGCVL